MASYMSRKIVRKFTRISQMAKLTDGTPNWLNFYVLLMKSCFLENFSRSQMFKTNQQKLQEIFKSFKRLSKASKDFLKYTFTRLEHLTFQIFIKILKNHNWFPPQVKAVFSFFLKPTGKIFQKRKPQNKSFQNHIYYLNRKLYLNNSIVPYVAAPE